jgi:hypothetical protein
MIKFFYRFIGLIFTVFIIFIFSVNYNLLRFSESFFLRIYYSIKINLIYYLIYIIYMIIYYKFIYRDKHKHIKTI